MLSIFFFHLQITKLVSYLISFYEKKYLMKVIGSVYNKNCKNIILIPIVGIPHRLEIRAFYCI